MQVASRLCRYFTMEMHISLHTWHCCSEILDIVLWSCHLVNQPCTYPHELALSHIHVAMDEFRLLCVWQTCAVSLGFSVMCNEHLLWEMKWVHLPVDVYSTCVCLVSFSQYDWQSMELYISSLAVYLLLCTMQKCPASRAQHVGMVCMYCALICMCVDVRIVFGCSLERWL